MSRVEHTQKFPVTSNTTAADIKAWLGGIPGDAKVSVSTSVGDWNYPDTHALTASWSTEASGGW